MSGGLWYHARITNWHPRPLAGRLECLGDLLLLEPDEQATVAPGSTTANLSFSPQLTCGQVNPPSPSELVPAVCDLLSFASRRAVSFETDQMWWAGRDHANRGGQGERGPVEQASELQVLIEKAVPILLDQGQEQKTNLHAGLRWFLNWPEGNFVELRYIVLWIVLEMLAKAYWRQQPKAPTKDARKVEGYLQHIGVPCLVCIPVDALCCARNTLVHGDPSAAYGQMWDLFGPWVQHADRIGRMLMGCMELGASQSPMSRDPNSEYNAALNAACQFLSRVLEKVFLSQWGCQSLGFYKTAQYLNTFAP